MESKWYRTKDQLPAVGQRVIVVRSTGEEMPATYKGPTEPGRAHWVDAENRPYWGQPESWRPLD